MAEPVTQLQIAKAQLQKQLQASIKDFESKTRIPVIGIDVDKTRAGEDGVTFDNEPGK